MTTRKKPGKKTGDVRGVYLCEHCDTQFRTLGELRTPEGHDKSCLLWKDMVEEKKLPCDDCGQEFQTQEHLGQHRSHYHVEEHVSFSVTIKGEDDPPVPVRTSSRANKGEKYAEISRAVKGNSRAKTGAAKFQRSCQYCGQALTSKSGVSMHEKYCMKNPVKKDTTERKGFKCIECGEVFDTAPLFKKHKLECQGATLSEPETEVSPKRFVKKRTDFENGSKLSSPKTKNKPGPVSSKKSAPVDDGEVPGCSSSESLSQPPAKKIKASSAEEIAGSTKGKKVMLKCKQCDMLFNGHMDFINHMDMCKVRDINALRQCACCGKEYDNYSLKLQHENECSQSDNTLVTCFDCHLPIAKDEMTQEDGFCQCGLGQTFTCSYCTKKFTSMNLLSSHMDSCTDDPDSLVNREKRRLKEEAQQKDREMGLTKNKKMFADDENVCAYCGLRNFRNDKNLEAHEKFCKWVHEQKVVRNIHGSERSRKISEAFRARTEALKAQANSPQPEPRVNPWAQNTIFMCSYCTEKFPSMNHLSIHLDTCIEDPENNPDYVKPEGKLKLMKVVKSQVQAPSIQARAGTSKSGVKIIVPVKSTKPKVEPIEEPRHEGDGGMQVTVEVERPVEEHQQHFLELGPVAKKPPETGDEAMPQEEEVMEPEEPIEHEAIEHEAIEHEAIEHEAIEHEAIEEVVKEEEEEEEEADTEENMETDGKLVSKNEFLCKYCNSMFGNRACLVAHIRKCKPMHGNLKEKDEGEDGIEIEAGHVSASGDILCKTCGDSFHKSEYARHASQCIANLEHVCTECGNVYPNRRQFQLHIKRCSECKIQGQVDGSPDHPADTTFSVITAPGKSSTSVACDFCSRILVNHGALARHEKVCRMSFKKKKKTSSDEGSFKCSFCQAFFYNKGFLVRHHKFCKEKDDMSTTTEANKKPESSDVKMCEEHKCSYCPAKLGSNIALICHERSCKSREEQASINTLMKVKEQLMKKNAELLCTSLSQEEEDEEDLNCPYCKVELGNKGAKTIHMRYCKLRHTEALEGGGSGFRCNYCKITLASEAAASLHLLSCKEKLRLEDDSESSEADSDEVAEEEGFICSHCKVKFNTKAALISHMKFCKMKGMTSGPPFICAFCKTQCEERGALVAHLKNCKAAKLGSSGEESYSCHKCSSGFITKSGWMTHMRFCKGPTFAPKVDKTKKAPEALNPNSFVPQGKVLCLNCMEEFGNIRTLQEHSLFCSVNAPVGNGVTHPLGLDVAAGEGTSSSDPSTPPDTPLRYFFLCPHCGAHYRNKQTLQYHIVACLSGVDYPRGEPDPAEVAARLAKEKELEAELERQRNMRKCRKKSKKDGEDDEKKVYLREKIEKENAKLKEVEENMQPGGPRAAQKNRSPDKRVKFRSACAVEQEKAMKMKCLEMEDENGRKTWLCVDCGWITDNSVISFNNHRRYCSKGQHQALAGSKGLSTASLNTLYTCDICMRVGFHNLGSLSNHKQFCKWLQSTKNETKKVGRPQAPTPEKKVGMKSSFRVKPLVGGNKTSPNGKQVGNKKKRMAIVNLKKMKGKPLNSKKKSKTTLTVKAKAKPNVKQTKKSISTAKAVVKKTVKRKNISPVNTMAKKKMKVSKQKEKSHKIVSKNTSNKTIKKTIKTSKTEKGKKILAKNQPKAKQAMKVASKTVSGNKNVSQIDMFACDFCNRTSHNRGAISQHMKYCYHRKGRPFSPPQIKSIKTIKR